MTARISIIYLYTFFKFVLPNRVLWYMIVIVNLSFFCQTKQQERMRSILQNVDLDFVNSVLDKYDRDSTRIIAIMQDVQ